LPFTTTTLWLDAGTRVAASDGSTAIVKWRAASPASCTRHAACDPLPTTVSPRGSSRAVPSNSR
jgi:hypothetical protein